MSTKELYAKEVQRIIDQENEAYLREYWAVLEEDNLYL